jgi:hypothetical protein
MTASTTDGDVDRLLRGVGDALVRAKLEHLDPAAGQLLDPAVAERLCLDLLDSASYYAVSSDQSTRSAAEGMRKTAMGLAKLLKTKASRAAAREAARRRAREEQERLQFIRQVDEMFGRPADAPRLAASPSRNVRTKQGGTMTESTQDAVERFYEEQRQIQGWISSEEKRAAEEDAQKRLDALAVQRREREDREMAALRARERRAAELAAEEEPAWQKRIRERFGKDPLRG